MTDTTDYFNRIKSFLYKSESDELILLKSHLLIEEMLDSYICFNFGPKISKKLNLNFYRKVLLVCGLINIDEDSALISQIFLINKIRNNLAHNLDLDIKIDLIGLIKNSHGGLLPKTINRQSTYLNSLKRSFYAILGELYGLFESYQI